MKSAGVYVLILCNLFFANLVFANELSFDESKKALHSGNVELKKIFYIAKHGDNLISILKMLNIRPIYGANGQWQKTVAMNSFMAERNGKLIFPGNKIYISDSLLKRIETVAKLADDGEIILSKEERLPAQAEVEIALPNVEAVSESMPERDKLPAPEAEPGKALVDYSAFSVASKAKYFRIEGYDSTSSSKAILLSNMGTGIELGWAQKWSQDFETHFNISAVRLAINESATKTIEQRNQELLDFEVGSRFFLSERTSIETSLGSQEELVYRALATTTVKIEKMQSPVLTLGLNQEFKKLRKLSVGGGIQFKYYSSFKNDLYEAASSTGWATYLGVKHVTKNKEVFGNMNYSTYERSLSPLTLKHTDFGVTIGIGWNWDAD